MHIRTRILKRKCHLYFIMNINSSIILKVFDILIVLSVLSINTVSGILVSIDSKNEKNTERISISVFLFLSAFLLSIKEKFKLKENSIIFQEYSKKYQILRNKIDFEFHNKIKKDEILNLFDEFDLILEDNPSFNIFIDLYYRKIYQELFIISDDSSDSS